MTRIAYVDGLYVHSSLAAVSIEDRGFQFADAVYEVIAVKGGKACHLEQHLDRLGRSLDAIAIAWPVPRAVLPGILAQVISRNYLRDGVAYVQVSRGVAPRNHPFPDTAPTLVVSAWRTAGPSAAAVEQGVAVVTAPDLRWQRPGIKTVGLLANVLARQGAKEAGAYEAWLVDEARGVFTEGTASNAFIVDAAGRLVTHPDDGRILGGITRANVLTLAAGAGLGVEERPFTVAEALAAREAFVTGTTATVLPVTRIDGHSLGKPGPVAVKLRQLYQDLRP